MSKRNIILLIILLVILALVAVVATRPNLEVTEEPGGSTGNNFFSNFFNFSGLRNDEGGDQNTPDTNAPVQTDGYTVNGLMFLRKASSMPVAGFGVLEKEVFAYVPPPEPIDGEVVETEAPETPTTEYQTTVRYVAIENGNLYQTEAGKPDERKVSDATIPLVREALFAQDGSSVILRYLKNNSIIETFVRELPAEVLGADSAVTGKIDGSFLPEDVTDIVTSPEGKSVFYITNIRSGASGTIANSLGKDKDQVFNSAYTEWLADWPHADLITVTTKPSAGVPGYMYGINPHTKSFNKIMGNIDGLTTKTSPNGDLVLYAGDNLRLSIYNIETGETTNTNISTLPEKCTWFTNNEDIFCGVPSFTPAYNYPDSWYQGEVSFTDNVWHITASTGNGSMILNPTEESRESVDIIKPTLSADGDYMFFLNKKDYYLWELKLK